MFSPAISLSCLVASKLAKSSFVALIIGYLISDILLLPERPDLSVLQHIAIISPFNTRCGSR